MAKLLLLLLFPLSSLAQSGRYFINTVDEQRVDSGYVIINDYYIRIENDTTITLPVRDRGEDRDRIYYILQGCENGRDFIGAAILYPSSSRKMAGGVRQFYYSLWIELRSRNSYSSTRYSIFYNE